MRSASKLSSRNISIVAAPAAAPRCAPADGLRGKRGAGDDWTTPSTVASVARAALCRRFEIPNQAAELGVEWWPSRLTTLPTETTGATPQP